MNAKVLGLISLFATTPSLSFADNIASPCSSCTSGNAYTSKAISLALEEEPNEATWQEIYLFNVDSNEARLYGVCFIPAEPGLPQHISVQKLTPNSSKQMAMDDGLSELSSHNKILSNDFIVPEDIVSSAYDT